MLLSLHVPKCGGTSFGLVLRRLFGPKLWLNYGTIFTRAEARPELIPAEATCIHGHFEADAFSEIHPDAPMITWVRHPVDRLVSNYHYFLRHPGENDYFSRILHEKRLTLCEFGDLEGMRDVAARHFASRRTGDFQFVGVMEHFSESMTVFNHTFGFPDVGHVPFVNANPERRTSRYELKQSDFDHIAACNAADLRIYREAQERLDRELAAIGALAGAAQRPEPKWKVI
jgi:Sulfotransferase family